MAEKWVYILEDDEDDYSYESDEFESRNQALDAGEEAAKADGFRYFFVEAIDWSRGHSDLRDHRYDLQEIEVFSESGTLERIME